MAELLDVGGRDLQLWLAHLDRSSHLHARLSRLERVWKENRNQLSAFLPEAAVPFDVEVATVPSGAAPVRTTSEHEAPQKTSVSDHSRQSLPASLHMTPDRMTDIEAVSRVTFADEKLMAFIPDDEDA